MKKEYDFSNGVRGKFYRGDVELNLPIYLDKEISDFVDRMADKKHTDRNTLVNLLLKKDKAAIDLAA